MHAKFPCSCRQAHPLLGVLLVCAIFFGNIWYDLICWKPHCIVYILVSCAFCSSNIWLLANFPSPNSFLTILGQLCWNRSIATSTPDATLSTENVISGITPDILVRIWPPKSVLSIKQSFSACWCAHWNLFTGSWKLKSQLIGCWVWRMS